MPDKFRNRQIKISPIKHVNLYLQKEMCDKFAQKQVNIFTY